MGRMTLMTGDERRRRWSDEERARILAAIEELGAVVAEVARRADVCTSLVYKWRREARATANDLGFAQVVVENAPRPPMRSYSAARRRWVASGPRPSRRSALRCAIFSLSVALMGI
jgi:transposase-like protein